MTDQPESKQPESANSVTNVSGGVDIDSGQTSIGGDVVGRDKIVHIGNYYAGGEAPLNKPKVYHNLPQPDYGQFIGREQELKRVHELLSPTSRHFVVTIDGIGGIGKSALALEIAHHYLRNFDCIPFGERFEAIIWASAKQTVLTVEGIMHRRQALRTLDDIYTTIAIVLRREDITRARREEQLETVRNALAQQRALLVIDNLETVDDETLMEFIRELPAPTKAVVTTRHRIDVAYPVRLAGLPSEDAMLMIGQECAKKSVRMSEEEARRLYRRTGGVPLAIVWSIAQMGLGSTVEIVLRRLAEPTNDIAKFCFEGSFERVKDRPARKLLAGLSIFATDASRETLGYITDLPKLDRDDGLVDLERLSLVNHVADRFALLPLTKSYALNESDADVIFQYRQRALDWMVETLEVDSKGEWPKYFVTDHEKDNFLQLIYWGLENRFYKETFQTIRRLYDYLWSKGFWNDLLGYLSLALKKAEQLDQQVCPMAEQLNQQDYLAIVKRQLAYIYRFQGRFDEAVSHMESACVIVRNLGNRLREAEYVRSLGMIYLDKGDTQSARRQLKASLLILENVDDPNREGSYAHILNCLTDVALKENQLDEARSYLDQSQEIAERLGIGISLTVIYRLRGKLEFASGLPENAVLYLLQGLEYSVRLGLYQDQGYSHRWLAAAMLSKGDLSAAQMHAGKALEIFTRLGMKNHLKKTEQLMAKIESEITKLRADTL
jgi:tetratricopeptide (TPR) repeat protein